VDPGEPGGVPLADCLGSFFAMPAPLPVTPPATSSASVLDQVPPLSLALRGHPIADLLRPAYDSFAGAEPEPGLKAGARHGCCSATATPSGGGSAGAPAPTRARLPN